MSRVLPISAVHYPETDGKPMGETDEHRDAMMRHIELLRQYYADQQVYVSGDLLVYYEQGNPKKFIVPDAFVVKGIEPGKRRIYKMWVEGKAPDVVIETTSRKTRRKDTTDKPKLYASLGVKEYFLFDPDAEYLDPPLQGYRLVGTSYEKLQATSDNELVSEELQLLLSIQSDQLQFRRADTGEVLLTGAEQAVHAEAEIARLRAELARRDAADTKS